MDGDTGRWGDPMGKSKLLLNSNIVPRSGLVPSFALPHSNPMAVTANISSRGRN